MSESAAGTVNAAADALEEARGDQQRAVVDEAADERGEREDRQRADQHAAAAEQVGGAAAEQQHAAEAEHVGRDDPLQLGGGEAEVGLDRRQRDADHRDVEPVEEDDAAEQDQRAPEAGVPPLGGGEEEVIPRHTYMHMHLMHVQHMHAVHSTACPRTSQTEWRDLLARHARTTVALDDALGRARPRHERVRGARPARLRLRRAAADAGAGRLRCTSARARCRARSAGSRRTAWSSRAMCPEDRRGIAVCLTDEGRERYEAARPTHRRVLAENLALRLAGEAHSASCSADASRWWVGVA